MEFRRRRLERQTGVVLQILIAGACAEVSVNFRYATVCMCKENVCVCYKIKIETLREFLQAFRTPLSQQPHAVAAQGAHLCIY
jgi:hypothetical protein